MIPLATESGEPPRVRRADVVVDGSPVRARVRWIGRIPSSARRATPLAVWLDLHAAWRVADAPTAGVGEGFFALIVDAMEDEPPDELRVAGRVIRLVRPGDSVPTRRLDARRDLVAALEAELADPSRRWHARLGLERAGLAPPETMLDGPILEAWAQQEEDAWREGLRRLANAAPALSARVERRLWCTARFAGPARWPVWPVSSSDLAELREALLAPANMVDRVRAWLDDQPVVVTWLDETRADDGMPILAALNLEGETQVLWVRAQAPVPYELPPLEVVRIRLAGDGPWTIATPDGEFAMPSPARIFPLHPPGIVLAPLLGDWTLRTLLRASPRAGDSSAGLFFLRRSGDRAFSPPGVIQRFDAGVRPMLYIEQRGDFREARLWVGEQADPIAVVRIAPDGSVRDERTNTPVADAHIVTSPGRLVALVPLPEAGSGLGTMLIGFEVIDASGMRWSWPAARLPWQTQPARIAVDLRTWDGLPR